MVFRFIKITTSISNRMEQINQKNAQGRRHGPWEYYNIDGTLWCKRNYHHGKVHGVWENYSTNGKLEWRCNFYYNKRRGLEKINPPHGGAGYKSYHLNIR